MNDIIKIIKSLEDSNVLTDGITETVKDEMKKNTLLVEPNISSIVKCIRGRAVKKGEKILIKVFSSAPSKQYVDY